MKKYRGQFRKNELFSFCFEFKGKEEIYEKTKIFQEKYQTGYLPENIVNRCCDFQLLERKYQEYIHDYKNETNHLKNSLRSAKLKKYWKVRKTKRKGILNDEKAWNRCESDTHTSISIKQQTC